MKKTRLYHSSLCLAVSLILISGCSSKEESKSTSAPSHQEHVASGDLQETTASLTTLPAFLNQTSTLVKEGYLAAAAHVDVLTSIPCYCGCGKSAGHQSNLNCFISKVQSDGTVIWDDHGTRCNVCIETAMLTAEMKKQGKTTSEIRQFIDDRYQEGYAKPTPTPAPAEI
ncbi:hypothetical protein J2Z69_001347 [Paenibacillus shirakamiensis]|uniref:Lipoprotein n=1 Tax=Paenibacillus shirakamiensis TaxID=1265935 RepID=A0ABS4JF44_9BACL|nr:PCYCGC motif-containing (lipo)protein [Paenibacillus shirakamiensis]MBP2000328.1 hypothetical protein [Paenibacillus shirakamiensis]